MILISARHISPLMSSFPTIDLCPFARRDGNDQDPGKYYLFTYLFVRVLVFSLDVREQGMGRDTKEPIKMSPAVRNSQLG